MKRIALALTMTGVSLLGFAHRAHATVHYCSSTIKVLPNSRAESTANLISITSTSSPCNNACGTYRRVYIEYADKDIFALALSAAFSGSTVMIAFKDDAPEKGGSAHGTYTCKALSIYNPG